VSSASRSVEITDVFLGFFSLLHLVHLFPDLSLNCRFSLLVFATDSINISSGMFASSVFQVVSGELLLVSFAVNSVYSIVETLSLSVDGVFKIQMLLGDMLTDDSPVLHYLS
jgi:hypothetical protein